MKIIATLVITLGLMTGAFAGGPGKHQKQSRRQNNKVEARTADKKDKKELRRVTNANPQHRGYPKADDKGNYPGRVDENVYYVEQ